MRKPAVLFHLLILVGMLVGCDIEIGSLKMGIDSQSPLANAAISGDGLKERIGLDVDGILVAPEDDKLQLLIDGDIDLAFISNSVPYTDGVSVLMPVYQDVLHVFTRKSVRAANLLELLDGRLVYVSSPDSAAGQVLDSLQKLKAFRGFKFEITHQRSDAVDVMFLMAPLIPNQFDALLDEWRLFSLADSTELGPGNSLELIRYTLPRMYTVLIPESFYGPEYTQPVATLGVDKILVSSTQVPAPLIYLMMQSLVENKAYFSSLNPIFFEYLGREPDPDDYNLPLHPGAWRYFNRDEPDFLERYADVINVAMYGVVLIVSLGIALYRSRRRVKKNRIDVFYAQLLEIRSRLEEGAPVSELRSEVRWIEDHALRMLINEELLADESMTIFLLQVQGLLTELDRKSGGVNPAP